MFTNSFQDSAHGSRQRKLDLARNNFPTSSLESVRSVRLCGESRSLAQTVLQPRSRGFPRSGHRPAVDGGCAAEPNAIDGPRFTGVLAVLGLEPARQGLKPAPARSPVNGAHCQFKNQSAIASPDDPPSTAGLLPLRGKPRERGCYRPGLAANREVISDHFPKFKFRTFGKRGIHTRYCNGCP